MFRDFVTKAPIVALLLHLPLPTASGGYVFDHLVAESPHLLSADSTTSKRPSEQPNRRAAWIDSAGLSQDVRNIMTRMEEAGLYGPGMDRVAQDLAVQYGFKELERLKARGIDFFENYASWRAPTPQPAGDLIAASDIMFIGEIVSADLNAYAADGFASTVVVRVREMLKGDTTLDTIRIRRIGGKLPNGHTRSSAADFDIVKKKLYVFRVSRVLYPLRVIDMGGTPVRNTPPFYTTVENPREIKDNGSLALPQGCVPGTVGEYKIDEIRTAAAQWRTKTLVPQ